jgi:hypothetical protein
VANPEGPKIWAHQVGQGALLLGLCGYADEGKSLTGTSYQHWQFGPFPPILYEVEEKIEKEGITEVRRFRSEDAGEELKIFPRSEPQPRQFEAWGEWQRALVDGYIRKVSE